MGIYDLNKVSNIDRPTAHTIPNTSFNIQGTGETKVSNDRFQKDWNAFSGVSKLRSAIIMKAIWTVGKGYTCAEQVQNQLNLIKGFGKQTFRDIIFSMIVTKQVARDAFAYKVTDESMRSAWNPEGIINLIILDSSQMIQVYNGAGQLIHYELHTPRPNNTIFEKAKNFVVGKAKITIYQPEEIFHLTHNRFAGETQGRSVPEGMEKIILADDKAREVASRTAEFQAVPFIVFKVKSDDATTINTIKQNIKDARENGQDMVVPDDENVLSFQTVSVNPSTFLLDWINTNDQEFYRAAGMPMVLFGGGGTESNGKTSYLGHETVFENDQRYIEEQVYMQLGFKIELNSPASLIENLQLDEKKDAQNGINFQQNDVTAGSGRDAE